MNYLDNMLLHDLYHELDKLDMQRKEIKKYRTIPQGMTMEQALQEIDEEEICIRAKIEELSIVESDYFDETF